MKFVDLWRGMILLNIRALRKISVVNVCQPCEALPLPLALLRSKVCFQEAAKPTSTADMRRIADRQLLGRVWTALRWQGFI